MNSVHISVLLQETIDGLAIRKSDTIVDATLGGAGHTREVLSKFKEVKVIGLDADESAIERAEKKLKDDPNFTAIHTNFRHIGGALRKAGLEKVQGFIFDLGFSSDQLESSGRGFSFQRNEPLTMTFAAKPDSDTLTASEIVNTWSAETIATIIESYGEETFAKKIAERIVEAREAGPIKTTFELVDVVRSAVPSWYRKRKINPATKTFQALRIATNDELQALQEGLNAAWDHLDSERRISVISFHSLEDRIVKVWMKEKAKAGTAKLITKKPIVAARDEQKENPRSRSAKLRIIEKI